MMDIEKTAVIDESGHYRYSLTRTWDAKKPRVCWVMLNPSTADANVDDPTIRKCIGFSQRWGFGSLEVVNLFAWRSTSPKALLLVDDPFGPKNEEWVYRAVNRADKVVAAWGADAMAVKGWGHFASIVWTLDIPVWCLGLTKHGAPRHPCYLPYETPLVYWTGAREAGQ